MKKKRRCQMLALALTAAFLAAPMNAMADGDAANAESAALSAEGTEKTGAASADKKNAAASDGKKVTLRVCNWEEYIDLGDWDEEETIDLESGDIIGENPMVEDFQEWYRDTYGVDVEVEYSTFGTNEDLYNMLTLGDVYDLVCPSEYMFMKLMAEDQLVPLSDAFFDETDEHNYYMRGISPYIRKVFEEHEIEGKPWSDFAAGYMWGITGIVYNPEVMSHEEASSWKVLSNPKFKRRVTVKDNVRDSYFAAVGAVKHDLLTSPEFINSPDYAKRLEEEMNDVSPETIQAVQDYLQDVRENAYSFETDSGKADMITGKVVANYQWSGDAVYSLDQAEEDDYILNFAVPEEATNIYFDGWVMLKAGIGQDPDKQQAAEAFINFLSRPDNVIRNMYYIGYTSVIAGGDDPRVFEYCDWCYGAEEDEEEEDVDEAEGEAEDSEKAKVAEADGEAEDEEDGEAEGEAEDEEDGEAADGEEASGTVEYPLGYFFSGDPADEDFILTTDEEQLQRQLGSQYPSEESISRSSIMIYFTAEQNEAINRMWINVRCFNILDVPVWVWILLGTAAVALVAGILGRKQWKNKYYGD